ncbi:hypothetical protein [Natrononativus amylolyticus]|uniref:hypothetical protein n=1 Tax=Natrononativus amylolyticus TaxID=2963434 RepID=UPI0020CE62C7|nr:hypothetical protein [Natrononativus amylolyticus]
MSSRAPPAGGDSLLVTARRGRPWAEGLAAVALLVACTVVVGPLGALAGIVAVVLWATLGAPYAVAGGTVALVAAVPDGLDPISVGLVGAGFLAVLLAPAVHTPAPGRFAAVTVASALGLGGLAWAVARAGPLWLAGAVLLGALATAAYGLHRYELVRLGLVPETTAEHPTEEL